MCRSWVSVVTRALPGVNILRYEKCSTRSPYSFAQSICLSLLSESRLCLGLTCHRLLETGKSHIFSPFLSLGFIFFCFLLVEMCFTLAPDWDSNLNVLTDRFRFKSQDILRYCGNLVQNGMGLSWYLSPCTFCLIFGAGMWYAASPMQVSGCG